MYEKLKTTEAFLHAVFDSGLFLNLGHADARAMLLALLDVQVQVDNKRYTLDELDEAYERIERGETLGNTPTTERT